MTFLIAGIVSVETDSRGMDSETVSGPAVQVGIDRDDKLLRWSLVVTAIEMHPQFIGIITI